MSILVGNKSIFAMESGITHAYEGVPFCARGFVIIHVGGHSYGVCDSEATMLTGPLNWVAERITRRGSHLASFATEPNAAKIADAYRDAIYAPDQENKQFFGMPHAEFEQLITTSNVSWYGDLDAAFDDGSYLLQFDVGKRVRLVAFKSTEGYHHDPPTLRERWLEADEYYGILQRWCEMHKADWAAMPKES